MSSAEAHRSTYLHPKTAHQQRIVHVTKLIILRIMKCGQWQLLCITDCYVMSQNQLGLVIYLLVFIVYLGVSVTKIILQGSKNEVTRRPKKNFEN